MKRIWLILLCLVAFSDLFPVEAAPKRPSRTGEAAGYGSRDASVISMMGWGVGLAIGIATFCALMESSDSSGGGGGGSNGHNGNNGH